MHEEFKDELYEEAKKLIIEKRKTSAAFLQRELQLGYAKAAMFLDMMEEDGIIGEYNGAMPRKILK